MNDTMTGFGFPQTSVCEYEHWVVVVRLKQVTLGSLVLICREDAHQFSDISPGAFAELGRVIQDIERTLSAEFPYDKINYLMLMMVDPHVHFHVIPRYAETRNWEGIPFEDAGWPGPPNLGTGPELKEDQADALLSRLKAAWPVSS